MEICFRHLKEHGTTSGLDNLISFMEFEKIVDVPKYRELEKKFATSTDE
jgi:methylisocitrate lyase